MCGGLSVAAASAGGAAGVSTRGGCVHGAPADVTVSPLTVNI